MGLIHYENDFSSLIKDKAVVDFYATWCGPCKMFGPVFEDASKENDFNFIKLDVDKYSDIVLCHFQRLYYLKMVKKLRCLLALLIKKNLSNF